MKDRGEAILNKRNGFTLIEIIISIGIVSFLSVYLLQIFITAKNLNEVTYDLDNAVIVSKSVMESLSAGEKIGPDSDDIILKNARKLSDELIYTVKLGDDFQPADSDFVDSSYIMNITLDLVDSSELSNMGLYNISVDIQREKPYFLKSSQNKEIYALNASKGLLLDIGGDTSD